MPEEVSKCRRTLRQKISVENGTLEKDKKANETKQNINKKVNNNNGGQANKTKTMNVCGRYVNHTCWRGKNCTLKHPVMCDSDVYRKACGKSPGRPCVNSIIPKFAM